MCIGSGLLALPHATSRGGLVFAPIMTGIIAIWNAIAVAMMIRCKHFTENYSYPSGISSTYSKIAYVGAGWFGSYLTDFSIIVTLIGVCISFQITFAVLLQDLSFGSNNQIDSYSHSHSHHDHHTNHSVINQNHNSFLSYNTLALISGIIVLPLSCIKDINILSYFSFIGLVCLVCATIAIMFFGFTMYGNNMMNNPLEYNNNKYGYNTLPLFPQDIGSLTSFLGVSVFCFGLCSLAFPVEESMKKKGEFNTAVMFSIVFVWTVYAIVGDLGALLYAHDPSGIKDNILQNLPTDSIVASVVRFCMAGVGTSLTILF